MSLPIRQRAGDLIERKNAPRRERRLLYDATRDARYAVVEDPTDDWWDAFWRVLMAGYPGWRWVDRRDAQFVLVEDRGRSSITHLESGLRGVTLCGWAFEPDGDAVDRAPYDNSSHRFEEPPHATICADCHRVAGGGEIPDDRRERMSHIPGSGGEKA